MTNVIKKQNPMKKFVLPAIGLLASLLTAQAQTIYFYPTNLVVLEQATTNSDGGIIGIAQFQTNGFPVNSTNLPSTAGTSPIILGIGTSPNGASEGFMTLSANTNFLVIPGYNTAAPYTSVLELSTSANVPRAVATLDSYDNYALPIHNGNIYSGKPIRGAASDGLGNFWVSGNAPSSGGNTNSGNIGIIYVGTASSPQNITVTVTGSATLPNEQCLDILNGNLYLSTETSPNGGIYLITNNPLVSGDYPKVEGSLGNNSNVIQMSANSIPYAFKINPAGKIAYVADEALGGIVKWTNGASGWISNYTLSVAAPGSGTSPNAYGCTVDWSESTPVIYATTADSPQNYLVRIVDTNSKAIATVIQSSAVVAPTTIFRSVQFGPGPYPIITNEPVSYTTDIGQGAAFSVGAFGYPSLTYQWYSNSLANPTFVAVTGATNATLTLSSCTTAQSNSVFYVVVADPYGTAQSTNVTLLVDNPGPPINVEVTPSSQTVGATSTAVFDGSFVGSLSTLSYGWTLNGKPLTDGSFGASTISGSSTTSLTITNAFATNDGNYVFSVTNNDGHNSSAPAVLIVNDPTIITNVMGATNFPGSGSVALSVTAAGTGLSYQWYSNNVIVTGQTSSTYTAANQSGANTTTYSVVVTSTDGTSVTNNAVVQFTYLILQENFSYPNGSDLFTTPGTPWTVINTTEGSPEIVYSNMAQVAFTNATTDSQDLFDTNVLNDISQLFGGGLDGVYWVSFTVNLSTLPTSQGGVYFANLEDKDYNFYGRIFCLTSNNPNVIDFPASVPGVAFPGTYRLGISDSQGDYASNSSSGPTAVVPLDLAPGIDYTVVYALDYINLFSRMAVNPASSNDVLTDFPIVGVASGAADDAFDNTTSPPLGYGLRQRGGEGILYVGNLKVAAEPVVNGQPSYYGFGYVNAGIIASNPVIGLQPVGTTNYLANPFLMEVAASGIGAPGVGLTYAWYKNTLGSPSTYTQLSDSGDITGSATPALSFSSFAAADAGTYYVNVTGTAGTTQSASTVISVNTTPTAASFTLPGAVNPSGTPSVTEGTTLIFTGNAIGTGPITYQWYLNTGSGYTSVYGPSSSPTYSFAGEPALSGSYKLVATGGYGSPATSSVTVLTVTGPVSATIGYLRNLQDYSGAPTMNPSSGVVGTPGTIYSITGTVITHESITSSTTSSYYLQDSTGGMNLFITGDASFLPAAGDVVTATGTLEEYNNNLELDLTSGVDTYTIVSNNGAPVTAPLPAAQLLPWGYIYTATNVYNTPNLNSVLLNSNLLGSLVYMTNVYFEESNGYYISNYNATFYNVSNNTGVPFMLYTGDSTSGSNLNGYIVPPFATAVTGVLALYTTNYVIIVTSSNDIVTSSGSGSIANFSGAISGSGLVLMWTAVPGTSYSVLSATNVAGPYTRKLATGLMFGTTTGTYTATLTNTLNFYEISSP